MKLVRYKAEKIFHVYNHILGFEGSRLFSEAGRELMNAFTPEIDIQFKFLSIENIF